MRQIHLGECHSTQDVLKEQLHRDPSEEWLVSCDTQTHGRGRGDHRWTTLPSTLCFSMNLKGHVAPSFTALEVSVLIAKFFEENGSVLHLKWPNDLWDRTYKKCCGVLIQSTQEQMLTGIGINLFSEDDRFGGVFSGEGKEIDKKAWCFEIASFISQNRYDSTDTLRADWEKRCFHMNEHVVITEGADSFEGIFRGLGEHGEALLESLGKVMRVYNGSLRPLTPRP